MITTVAERSLTESLRHRIAVEEEFAKTGRTTFRKKAFLIRYEHIFISPWLKLGLSMVGLYSRGLRNAITPIVRRLTLDVPDLPPAFDGFELMQISDFHIDGVDGLAEALEPILSKLRPDVCVFTGDYRYKNKGSCKDVYPRMQKVISSISAEHGVFAILGNHDVSEIAFALEDMGVRMLINEAVPILRGNASVWLAGIDDPFDYRCDDLSSALSSVPPHAFKILLAHTPELYADAAQHGTHVYLCGHTHAGQIRFPWIGSIRHNAECPKEYSEGQWSYRGMQGYTTTGVGSSMLPIRYNCPPEVVLIQLRRGPAI